MAKKKSEEERAIINNSKRLKILKLIEETNQFFLVGVPNSTMHNRALLFPRRVRTVNGEILFMYIITYNGVKLFLDKKTYNKVSPLIPIYIKNMYIKRTKRDKYPWRIFIRVNSVGIREMLGNIYSIAIANIDKENSIRKTEINFKIIEGEII